MPVQRAACCRAFKGCQVLKFPILKAKPLRLIDGIRNPAANVKPPEWVLSVEQVKDGLLICLARPSQ